MDNYGDLMVPKYRVIVTGTNCKIITDGSEQNFGFYTTRYIENEDFPKAEEIAVSMVRRELSGVTLNDDSDPPVVVIDATYETLSFDGKDVPGSGFTWFIEDRA